MSGSDERGGETQPETIQKGARREARRPVARADTQHDTTDVAQERETITANHTTPEPTNRDKGWKR